VTPLLDPHNIIVDLRCLQDPDYARRGVGRHALNLLRYGASRGGLRLIGLVDDTLPPVETEVRDLFQVIVSNAYAGIQAATAESPALSRRGCFLSLSPMTHDPLWTSRLMADKTWLRVSVVYDFIPRRKPERYLPTDAARLRYAIGLCWLGRSDLFASISRATGKDLQAITRIPSRDVVVTGCSIDPVFERIHSTASHHPPRHVLMVGGADPRKNPETLVRAHARAASLQEAGVPLVIAGNYDAAAARAFRNLATKSGGRPDLVEVPGHLDDAALLDLYARAAVMVCPSHDEGFSIPIVEAMAAGIPSVASDIPAHQELVEDPALRFAADDDTALSSLLDRIVTDPAWRQEVATRQKTAWPRFRAEEVGRRFWDSVLERLPSRAPAPRRGHRPRVALLSPVAPDRSGVADYTVRTCRELGRLVDLHVFTLTEDALPLEGVAAQSPLSALPHLMPSFDRVVSVVGNSHFHLRIFELLQRYGAACIAHDARMLGFYRVLLGLNRTLAVASKELQRPVGEAELNGWLADEGTTKALLLGEIAAAASPMIVHSAITAREVLERHGVAARHVPFSIYRPWQPMDLTPAKRAAARSRLGLGEADIAIATFGQVDRTKGPEECIWALDMLRGWGIPASLYFVGPEDRSDRGRALHALARELGIADNVRFMPGDYLSEQTYRDYLIAADLGIQLRTYGLGGLSGAVLDCAAVGLPTVANFSLAEAVGVPSYIRSIPDALSPVLLAEALAGLLEDGLSAKRPEAERSAFSESRSMRRYAVSLCEALSLEVSGSTTRQKSSTYFARR
jgi:glycosyltransferase involved in cell wall biosynthesis